MVSPNRILQAVVGQTPRSARHAIVPLSVLPTGSKFEGGAIAALPDDDLREVAESNHRGEHRAAPRDSSRAQKAMDCAGGATGGCRWGGEGYLPVREDSSKKTLVHCRLRAFRSKKRFSEWRVSGVRPAAIVSL
jgi:hypothetical protein